MTPLGFIAPPAWPAQPGSQIADGAAALPAAAADDAALQQESFDLLIAAMVHEDGARIAPPSPPIGRGLLAVVERLSLRSEADGTPAREAEPQVLDPLAVALLIPMLPTLPSVHEESTAAIGEEHVETSPGGLMAPTPPEDAQQVDSALQVAVEIVDAPMPAVALPGTPRPDSPKPTAAHAPMQPGGEPHSSGVPAEVGARRSLPDADVRLVEAASDDAPREVPRETPRMPEGTQSDIETDGGSTRVASARRVEVVNDAPALMPQPEDMSGELPRPSIREAPPTPAEHPAATDERGSRAAFRMPRVDGAPLEPPDAPDTGAPVGRAAAAVRLFSHQAQEPSASSQSAEGDQAAPSATMTPAGAKAVEAHPAGHAPAQAAPAALAATPLASIAVSASAPLLASDVQATSSPEAENLARLVQTMRVAAQSGKWEATVRLKPEHLGEVTIAVRVEGHSVSAVVNAEAAGVRQWLQSQEESVRAGLADQGLLLERFVVSRDGQQRRQPEPRPERPRLPQRPRGEERFEVVV